MAEEVAIAGGEIVTLPVASKSPFTILANIGRIANLIEERGVDLVHARSRAPAWSAFLAARRTSKPFVTTYHGAYGEVGPFKAAYNSVMAQRRPRHRQFPLHRLGDRGASATRAEDRIRVIHRGVDRSDFDPPPSVPARSRRPRELNGAPAWRQDRAACGSAHQLKGQRDLIAAAARANQEGALDDAVVILAGDAHGRDGYRVELIGLIARHGLGDKVRLVGHCRDMPAAYLAHSRGHRLAVRRPSGAPASKRKPWAVR